MQRRRAARGQSSGRLAELAFGAGIERRKFWETFEMRLAGIHYLETASGKVDRWVLWSSYSDRRFGPEKPWRTGARIGAQIDTGIQTSGKVAVRCAAVGTMLVDTPPMC